MIDTYEKLDIGIGQVTQILHVADIHIRLTKRHDEYREAFNKIYDYIDTKLSPNAIIAILGDVLHGKVDLSPEAIQLTSEFFRNCSDRRPTIVIAGNHDCYSADHELLTQSGWINIADYVNSNSTDAVATFNVETSEMEFQPPTGLIKKEFNGELVNLTGKNVDLLVTPTHQVLYHWNASGKYYKKNAIEITKSSEIPINGRIRSFIPDPFYKLLGFSFAEGTFVLREHTQNTTNTKYDGSRVQFHLKCEREINYLSNVLVELGYKFKLRPQKDGTYYIVVYSDLGKRICKYFDDKKEIPTSIFSATISQMRSFLDGYLHGDGSSVGLNGQWRFASISEKSIDILHTLIRLCGGRSGKSNRVIYGNYENSQRQYLCSAFIDNEVHFSPIQQILKTEYSGYVYCVSVPNTNLFVRRGQKISISGNCLLTNKTRLDSISPIVANLAHKNLFYLKESKLYGAGNILLNNFSIFDDPTSFIKMKNVTKRLQREFDTKIALFHGGVHSANTDIGFKITNRIVTADSFDGHDIVLLGDIHKEQTMFIEHEVHPIDIDEIINTGEWEIVCNPSESTPTYAVIKKFPILRYSGSAIQQNHGEALRGHGFSVWDIPNRKFEHVEISNDYGYFTVLVENGKLVTDISSMPIKAKLRVNCKESVATEVKRIVTDIKKTHQISDIVYVRIDSDTPTNIATKSASNLSQIGNVDYQNKLIGEYLVDRFPTIDKDTLSSIFEINKTLNSTINKDDQSRNIRWKPKRFEFDNLFSYGEGNVLDFTKLSDVYGLFAPNASGKSSLFDALSFIAFDKSSKAFKASHIMNTQKMSFKGKFTFEVNGIDYVIVRSGARDKKNNVKVDVNFYKIVEGKEVPLNAEARRSTNEIIRDYLGSYDDFILTTLSLQSNRGSFVDMGQTERKELLSQFIGITLFDKLTTATNDKLKELGSVLRAFNKEDNTSHVAKMENEIDVLTSKISDLDAQNQITQSKIKELSDKIENESKSIVNLHDVPTQRDADNLVIEKTDLERKVSSAREKIETWGLELIEEKKKLELLLFRTDELESMGLVDKKASLTDHQKRYSILEKKLNELKFHVAEKLKKLEHLELHKYDPNCPFCTNNIFVKDAMNTRSSLESDKKDARLVVDEMKTIKSALNELIPYQSLINELDGIPMNIAIQKSHVSRKQLETNNGSALIDRSTSRLSKIEELLTLYSLAKDILEKNSQIDTVISELKSQLNRVSNQSRDIHKELLLATGRKVSLTDQITTIQKRIGEIETYQNELAAYEYYLSAMGPNGLQYRIISSAIPQIESEVNNILSQIVEFGMNIETDGKNVNVYIKYEDKKWPLELCSGMEKFVAGLALRVALINISNLPRPNFMVVDEGFGALDADNMGTMHALFDFLKTNFDFIIIISHLDVMRDMVEKQLEIRKENGFSRIDNSK